MLRARATRGGALIAVALLMTVVSPALADDGTVFIDFEHFPGPDGIIGTADDIPAPTCNLNICGPLNNQFASMGITFTRGTLFQGNFFPGSAPTNHFISSTPPDATFTRRVTGISITSYSIWTATLYALDADGNIIATNTLTNPNAGSAFLLGTLSVSAGQAIARFTVLPAGCQIGGSQCSPILNLDNLTLIATAPPPPVDAPNAVPALGAWPLAGLIVLFAFAAAWLLSRRRGKA